MPLNSSLTFVKTCGDGVVCALRLNKTITQLLNNKRIGIRNKRSNFGSILPRDLLLRNIHCGTRVFGVRSIWEFQLLTPNYLIPCRAH